MDKRLEPFMELVDDVKNLELGVINETLGKTRAIKEKLAASVKATNEFKNELIDTIEAPLIAEVVARGESGAIPLKTKSVITQTSFDLALQLIEDVVIHIDEAALIKAAQSGGLHSYIITSVNKKLVETAYKTNTLPKEFDSCVTVSKQLKYDVRKKPSKKVSK